MLDPNRNRNQQYNDLPALPGPKPLATKALTPPSLPAQAGTAYRKGQQQIVGAMKGAVTALTRPVVEPIHRNGPQVLASVAGGIEDFGRAAVGAAPRSTLVAPPVASPQPSPARGAGGPVPAAQAATPPSRTALPLAQPARFTDPVGRARHFADPGSANAAAVKVRSPEGVAGLRNEALQRGFDLTSTGQIPEGTFTPEEQALVAPELRAADLDGTRVPGPAQPVGIAPAAAAAEGVDVIRGTQVSTSGGAGTGGGGGSFDEAQDRSPTDIYRDALAANLQAGLEHGADIRQYAPEIKFLAQAEQRTAAARKESQGRLPTLSQFQAQRAQELTQNPGGINSADQLVFGKGGASAAPKLYSKPEYDQYGAKTSEVPYLYDAEGNARPLNFVAPAATGAPEGSAASVASRATADANRAVKLGKLTRAQANERLRKAGFPEI